MIERLVGPLNFEHTADHHRGEQDPEDAEQDIRRESTQTPHPVLTSFTFDPDRA
jgi:hypothetical protein